MNEEKLAKLESEAKELREKFAEINGLKRKRFSLDEECRFERIECNGRTIYVTEDMDCPTYRQILDKCVGDWEYGSYNIIAESYLYGLVLNYGNYPDIKEVIVVGVTQGFA